MFKTFIDKLRAFFSWVAHKLSKNDVSEKTDINTTEQIKILSCKIRYVKEKNEN